MYRPKVYSELLPVLFETARIRQVPVTRMTNSFIYRALQTEYLPISALKMLPPPADLKSILLRVQESNRAPDSYAMPFNMVSRLSAKAEPFKLVSEATDWYQLAIDGTARALKLATTNSHVPCKRSPPELNVNWRYENLAIQLNQILAESFSHLSAYYCRNRGN